MNLLSLFRSSPEKQIERSRKKVKEPHGDSATRMNAALRLREMGTPESILALLDRFTIDVSPSGQDEEEKKEVLSWIVQMGEEAVEPLFRFLKRERQLYWPVKALRETVSEQKFAQKMNEVLRGHWENPPASSDPTAQLIRLLEGVRTPELVGTIRLFLEDQADDVRLAALDYLFAHDEDDFRETILKCYLDSEERPRIRGHILSGLVEHGWSVKGFRAKVEETLPDEFKLTRDGLVKAMGK
jgi:HEAT repeat protein